MVVKSFTILESRVAVEVRPSDVTLSGNVKATSGISYRVRQLRV